MLIPNSSSESISFILYPQNFVRCLIRLAISCVLYIIYSLLFVQNNKNHCKEWKSIENHFIQWYNITIVIDKNILPQLLNKKKEMKTMGKRNKKSSKKTNVEMILLATAIIQFIAAIITLTNVIISLNWKYRGGKPPHQKNNFFLTHCQYRKRRIKSYFWCWCIESDT